jgi:HK97 family phage major capsid protein
VAITAPTTTSDFEGFLNPAQSAPIFDEAARQSVVQRLARRVPLGANGQTIPITTSKPTAGWVDEGGQKPSSAGGRGLVPMVPKKLSAIVVNSAEVVRADPGGYITGLRADLAEAFAIAFDYAALYNLGGDGTGSGPFDNYLAETTKAVTLGTATQAEGGIHADIVAGLELLVSDGKRLTGFAFDDVAEPTFLSAVDSSGRPIYIDTPLDDTTRARNGRLIGRPSWMGEGLSDGDTVGFGGDFRKVAWGVVGGISYDVSDQATVTIDGALTSLWEHNLVAIRAEAEYGLVIADVEAFVAYNGAGGS